jgi:thiamine-monophosphate kinase
MPKEFDLIKTFAPLAAPEGLGLLDDAAIFTPPAGRDLVISADAIVEGVHFLPTDAPGLIARKLLRVNLSDLAAMGAVPLHYLLTVSVPGTADHKWFAAFADGLAQDQAEFGLSLLGGDTTSTPGPISLSATIIGHVAPGRALRRAGARAGDELWVTGTIGDGALGLLALRGEIEDPDGYLAGRYHLPQPRLGLSLHGIVSAAMDVSDGLVQDAGHLASAAGLGVEIEAERVPLSEAGHRAGRVALCLTGGDDYELLLAVPPEQAGALQTSCAALGLPVARVGRFTTPGSGAIVLDSSGTILPIHGGWSHF